MARTEREVHGTMVQNRGVENVSTDGAAIAEERHRATIHLVIHEYFPDCQALTTETFHGAPLSGFCLALEN